MDRRAHIEGRLRETLDTKHLEVVDESHLHAGHAGARDGRGHFRAVIVSERFAGASRVARQRLVFDCLADEMRTEIHALSMQTFTPDEWTQRSSERPDPTAPPERDEKAGHRT